MTSQDVITYKQERIIFIKDEVQKKLFDDHNLRLVLKFLRKGPMTISDLIVAFKKHGEKKSDKSIYRYLQQLIKAKLIAKAGKRISTRDENDLVSETLFMRTAQAFITKQALSDMESEAPIFEALFLLIKQLYSDKTGNLDEFKELIKAIDEDRDKYTADLFINADEETNEIISELEGNNIFYSLDYASWLATMLKYDLKNELDNLFSK
ncbi:MAG: hypothetical protein FK730_05135 [Asgard group archaeon]|nr:hypothetical protein [Asgard group archaeon]